MSSTGTITSSGVGSNIDIEGLVTKLVAAEGQSKSTALLKKQAQVQAEISAYGSFKSALAQLQTSLVGLKDPAQFRSRSATVADDTIYTATATGSAAPGSVDIEVVQLAGAAKLRSGPLAASTTPVGTGTLTLSLGAASFAITIDSTNNTLANIRNAINSAPANPGISATLVTANDGVRLVLTSAATGAANAIKVAQSGGDGGLAALTYDPQSGTNGLTQLQAAQDARIVIDGSPIDSISNTINTALDGVSITLLKTTATGVTNRLSVAVDQAKPRGAITAFVTAYNQVYSGLKKLSAYDAATKSGGALLGDAVLRGFMASLRQEMTGTSPALAGNAFRTLSDIGVTTSLDGTLKVDTAKLDTAFNTNNDAITRLFSGDGGLGKRLDTLANTYASSGGLLESRTKGLQTSLDAIAQRQTALGKSLDAYEARVRAQFTAMDIAVAQMRQTGQNLIAQLDSLSTK